MSDRLAEIEARLTSERAFPVRIQDLRDLLAVAKAARALADAEDRADFAAMTRVMDNLRATLANLEGGAS